MFIQPKGRARNTQGRRKATGLIMLSLGALIFLTVIHRYMQRVMPSVRMAQAASTYYGYHGGHSGLRPADAAEERKIRFVISAQASALRHKNFAKAMDYSSIPVPDVTAEMYENFLEARYPQNAELRSVSFPDTAMLFDQNFALQRVDVTGKDGTNVQELYLMITTDSGWRIRRFRVLGGDGTVESNFNPWDDEH